MKTNQISNSDIVRYYETCQIDYSITWHLNTHLSMHYGYWGEHTKSLRQALLQINEVLAQRAGISATDLVLDAGCGVGGAAIYLAKRYGCQVTGLTLSDKHVAFARKKSAEQGLSEKTRFDTGDFTCMPYENDSFDVVWAMESICHAHEKADFLREAFRVLKKNGRLIIADFFRTMEFPLPEQAYWLDKWAHSWAVPNFEFISTFEKKGASAGFEKIQTTNITANILPSAKRLYYCFIPGIICDRVLWLLGKRNQLHWDNVWSTYYQYKALKRGLWTYEIVEAHKP